MSRDGQGYFEGKIHVLPIRVYYEDTDLSGMVYHANYLRYMERARTEFFRLAGVARMADLSACEPTAWAIREARIRYLKPARLDDALTVRTALLAMSGARVAATQKIYAGQALLVEGEVEACIVTLKGRPRRLAGEHRRLLTAFLAETDT
ncbi:MAG: YbgC/FadM family acyl-CoA thioesterase [Rhizomicrobium sp.]